VRDHREGHDPTPVDITAQLREAVRRQAQQIHGLRLTPPKVHRPRPKKQTDVRKARRRQADASRKRNR
jgi:hypothetical protein